MAILLMPGGCSSKASQLALRHTNAILLCGSSSTILRRRKMPAQNARARSRYSAAEEATSPSCARSASESRSGALEVPSRNPREGAVASNFAHPA